MMALTLLAARARRRRRTSHIRRIARMIKSIKDFFDPDSAAKDMLPRFGEDAYELEKAVGDTWDESDFDVISFIKGVFGGEEAEFLSLDELAVFCLADAACEDDCVVDEGVALAGQEKGFGEFGEQGFWC